jgi:hypothetical protein
MQMAEPLYADPSVAEIALDLVHRVLDWRWCARWAPEKNINGMPPLVMLARDIADMPGPGFDRSKVRPNQLIRVMMAVPLQLNSWRPGGRPPRPGRDVIFREAHDGRLEIAEEWPTSAWDKIRDGVWLHGDIYKTFEMAGADQDTLDQLLRDFQGIWNCLDFCCTPASFGDCLRFEAATNGLVFIDDMAASEPGDFMMRWSERHAPPWRAVALAPADTDEDELASEPTRKQRRMGKERRKHFEAFKQIVAKPGGSFIISDDLKVLERTIRDLPGWGRQPINLRTLAASRDAWLEEGRNRKAP